MIALVLFCRARRFARSGWVSLAVTLVSRQPPLPVGPVVQPNLQVEHLRASPHREASQKGPRTKVSVDFRWRKRIETEVFRTKADGQARTCHYEHMILAKQQHIVQSYCFRDPIQMEGCYDDAPETPPFLFKEHSAEEYLELEQQIDQHLLYWDQVQESHDDEEEGSCRSSTDEGEELLSISMLDILCASMEELNI